MYNHQLDTFIAAADSGSFTKAAEKLFISPNAVVKQMNILENNLGLRLFERTHRGVELAAAGRSLITPAAFLEELWLKINAIYPDLKFRLVPYENTPENAREIMMHFGEKIDFVAGIYDQSNAGLSGMYSVFPGTDSGTDCGICAGQMLFVLFSRSRTGIR